MMKLDQQLLTDLDQLREIMKITGTPTVDFVVKLQSQEVSVTPPASLPAWYLSSLDSTNPIPSFLSGKFKTWDNI